MQKRSVAYTLSLTALSMLLATGCSNSTRGDASEAMSDAKKEAAEAVETARNETQEAWEKLSDFTFDQKSDFRSTLEREVDEIDRDLEVLGRKVKQSTRKGAADVKVSFDDLRDERSALERQIDKIGDASKDGWEKTKDAIAKSVKKIEDGTRDLEQKLG